MKRIILSVASCIVVLGLYAQRATNEEPYGLKESFRAQAQETIVLPAPDMERIKQVDLENDQKPGPVRFAYPVHVNYTPENSGEWQQLDDGSKIWRLKVAIPDALATITYYDKFWLPEGGKFFVYSEDTRQSVGAIISDFIGGSQQEPIKFATALIYGKNVVYEYYQPDSVTELPAIFFSRIDYGYRYINNPYKSNITSSATGLGTSESCNININCPEGEDWQKEKHAVARVSIPQKSGTYACSCALINNTGNDKTPYILTADHCLIDPNSDPETNKYGYDAVNDSDASQWKFYWEYEHPGCANSSTAPVGWEDRTSVGAMVVANDSISDFALLQINAPQDPRYIPGVTPYYLGWDHSGSSGTAGVGIHHPNWDVKKISTANKIENYPNQIDWKNGRVSLPNTHWNVTFYNGYTQGGSSGSPLINNFRRIVGQLGGGVEAGCNSTINYMRYYGKFNVSWDNNPNPKRQLKHWLDPMLWNTPVLDGTGINCDPVVSFSGVIDDVRVINACDTVKVNNVTVNNTANVTIIAGSQIVITSMVAEGYMVIGGENLPSSTKSAIVYAAEDPPYVEEEEEIFSTFEEEATEPTIEPDTRLPYLGQNYPNPFTGETVIPYFLPEGSEKANLRIINTEGIVLQTVNITQTGESAITLAAHALPPGVYFYSLLINGQVIDTKRMIVE